jgi:type III secretory pathway component EscS
MADLLETIITLLLVFILLAGSVIGMVVIFIQCIYYMQDEDDK